MPLTKVGYWTLNGSSTGSSTGTTAKPELPVLFPVLPTSRAFSSSRWQAVFGWAGSTALWAGTTGPAGFLSWREPLGAVFHGAVVPPLGPVLPVLRESEPNGQISQGTYLNVLSSPTVFKDLGEPFALSLLHCCTSLRA